MNRKGNGDHYSGLRVWDSRVWGLRLRDYGQGLSQGMVLGRGSHGVHLNSRS